MYGTYLPVYVLPSSLSIYQLVPQQISKRSTVPLLLSIRSLHRSIYIPADLHTVPRSILVCLSTYLSSSSTSQMSLPIYTSEYLCICVSTHLAAYSCEFSHSLSLSLCPHPPIALLSPTSRTPLSTSLSIILYLSIIFSIHKWIYLTYFPTH